MALFMMIMCGLLSLKKCKFPQHVNLSKKKEKKKTVRFVVWHLVQCHQKLELTKAFCDIRRELVSSWLRGHIEYVSTKANINSSSHLREPATMGADGDNEWGRVQLGQMLNISDRVWSSLRSSVTPSSLVRVRSTVNIALHQLNIEGNRKPCKFEHNLKTVISLDKSTTTMLDIFAGQTHAINVLMLDFLAEVSIYYLECIPNTILNILNSIYRRGCAILGPFPIECRGEPTGLCSSHNSR